MHRRIDTTLRRLRQDPGRYLDPRTRADRLAGAVRRPHDGAVAHPEPDPATLPPRAPLRLSPRRQRPLNGPEGQGFRPSATLSSCARPNVPPCVNSGIGLKGWPAFLSVE